MQDTTQEFTFQICLTERGFLTIIHPYYPEDIELIDWDDEWDLRDIEPYLPRRANYLAEEVPF